MSSQCSICYTDITDKSLILVSVPCQHWACHSYALNWHLQCQYGLPTCHMCRAEVRSITTEIGSDQLTYDVRSEQRVASEEMGDDDGEMSDGSSIIVLERD